jgi:hypothetical protein
MLRPRSPQESFYGSYLYDKIVPQDHLLRKTPRIAGKLSLLTRFFYKY